MPEIETVELDRPPNAVDLLSAATGSEWKHLRSARSYTRHLIAGLRTDLKNLDNQDASIVVFGSLAREEATPASDYD